MKHLSKIFIIFWLLALAACGTAAPEPAAENAPAQEESAAEESVAEEEVTTAAESQPGELSAEVDLTGFPVTVESCGEPVTFDAPPERAVTSDVNITEIFLDVGLADKLVGYSGINDTRMVGADYRQLLADVPQLSPKYIDLEVLVGAEPDFFFAGWSYGFSEEKGITPVELEQYGIKSYVLTESCIRIMEREQVSLEDTFTDLLNIGRIFGVEDQAQAKVDQYRAELAEIEQSIGAVETPMRVFVYDSGDDTPLTAAKFAMPNAMIEAAGGANIFNDVDSSWTRVNWEDVVDRNPQHIVIIDYDEPDAQGKIDFLKSQPALVDVDAIKNDRFVVLTYAEATPGPRNVARTRTLAEAFYPDKFGNEEAASMPAESLATGYPLTIENGDVTLTFEQAPEQAVSLNLHTTEIMLALGLADKMVGTAYGNAVILPEFEEAYNNIPVLAEKYPSMEVLAAAEPDFSYGRESAHRADGVGTPEDLAALGINAYTVKGTLVEAATMDDVYEDIHKLGQIFDIQPRAEAMIQSMKDEIAATQAQVGDISEPVRVLVYDFGTDDLFTAGQSLQTHLIGLAGGRNVFDDVEKNWTTVSWEEAVSRNPDVIVINDYGETPAEEKIDFLLNSPALSSMPAIQNKWFVVLPLPSVFEGVRNPDAVETLARGFYPEKFGGEESAAAAGDDTSTFPLTIDNCGLTYSYDAPPERAVTMNQASTEVMLALGLEDKMVGTAYIDDKILPSLAEAYNSVPVLAEKYPSQEILFTSEPDFVYGAYRSAFGDEAAGPREELLGLDIDSYLSAVSCEDEVLRPESATMETVYNEIKDIAAIFGVPERGEALVADMQARLEAVIATIGDEAEPVKIFWYDSGTDDALAGACCGTPNEIIRQIGSENIFADAEGNWATVSWEEVIDRNPEAIVIIEADWSTADEKIELLTTNPAYADISAVQDERFIIVPFSATTLGIRNVDAVEDVAKGLYPDKFE